MCDLHEQIDELTSYRHTLKKLTNIAKLFNLIAYYSTNSLPQTHYSKHT